MLNPKPSPSLQPFRRPVLLAVFFAVIASDILLFDEDIGLNLFLWFLVVGLCMLLGARRGLSQRSVFLALPALACILPLIETPSWQGITVATTGLLFLSLAASGLLPSRYSAMPAVFGRLVLKMPVRALQGVGRVMIVHPDKVAASGLGRELRLWAMPLALTAVFVMLFASANPLIEKALASINLDALLALLDIWRIAFWLFMACFVWVLLKPRLARCRRRKSKGLIGPPKPSNEASLLRALVLFNLLFAVQTVLDMAYLWGGASLPEGMSHAEYAHRGSHPLIVTALLAGLFVLITMRHGTGGDARTHLIRRLVYLWIAQNILLCLSAMLRLDLYVEAYSLTRMRVAAGLWMLLVAVGLALILLKIVLRKTNAWLLTANATSLLVLFYGVAVADIPAFVASYNISHAREMDGKGEALDVAYLHSLGPTVVPAIDTYLDAPGAEMRDTAMFGRLQYVRNRLVFSFKWRSQDLWAWTLRTHRLEKYLAARPMVE